MLSKPYRLTARLLGVTAGVAIAVLIMVAARPSASTTSSLPATVSFSVPGSGELAVVPPAPEPFLVARKLRPEVDPVVASFTVSNQTGVTLPLGFDAIAEARGLDGLLRVRLRTGNVTLADTTLQGLRNGTGSVPLRSGAEMTFQLTAWIPPEIAQGYEGQKVDVALEPTIGTGAEAGGI